MSEIVIDVVFLDIHHHHMVLYYSRTLTVIIFGDVNAHSTLWHSYTDEHKRTTNSRCYQQLGPHNTKHKLIFKSESGRKNCFRIARQVAIGDERSSVCQLCQKQHDLWK